MVTSANMKQRVTTLRSKQYGEYGLSAIKYCAESIKHRKYLNEFEAKFKKTLKGQGHEIRTC